MNIDRLGRIDLSDVKYVAPETHTHRLANGDVLFNNTNSAELIGKTAAIVSDEDWGFSNHMTRLRLPEGVDHRFVAHQLHFLWMKGYFLHRCVHHVNQASLSSTSLAETVPLLLAPYEEQHRIVAKIEELFSDLDAGVAALERVRTNLKRYRASVLKAAVEGKLTEDWRAQHPDTEPASVLLERILTERRRQWEKDQLAKFAQAGKQPPRGWQSKYKEPESPATLPHLPHLWITASVEQISTKVVDGVHKRPDYVSQGVPFVTVRNLTAGTGISFERLNYITEEDHQEFIKRANPERGDLLVSKDGTLGVTRIVRTDERFSIFVSVALIKPVSTEFSEFLGHALSSQQVQSRMIPKGIGLQHIHLEDLRKVTLPIPPLDEQGSIVEEVERRLSVVDEVEAQVDANLKRAARLRQGILKRAFEGRLVPQDPSDEPAEKLLGRIGTNGVEARTRIRKDRRSGTKRGRLIQRPLLPEY
jgi:type I restriction enzyme S subunit